MELQISFGLPFLHQLLDANVQDQGRMTHKMGYTSGFLGKGLHEYLERYQSRYANLQNISGLLSKSGKLKFRGDDLQLGRNEGFLWANEDDVWEDCAYDDGEGLRRCGYVLWGS